MFKVWLSLPEKRSGTIETNMIRDMSHFSEKEDVGKISAACDPREKVFCGIARSRGGCTPLPQGRASEPPPPTNVY